MSQSSQQQQSSQPSSQQQGRSSTSRFSLTLLEPGEICFEDYLVYYNEFENPFDSIGKDKSAIDERNYQKGSLKICLKSVVFDPFNLSYPLLRFPLKQVEKLVLFNEESEQEVQLSSSYDVVGEEDDIYGAAYKPPSTASKPSKNVNSPEYKQLKVKCFAIKAKQVIQCKVNNKIGPYKAVKRENPDELHYFQFIFTNVDDSLSLLGQLLRASTLNNYEEEDIMLQKILKGSLKRNFTFDRNKMDDMYREQIQFECEVNKISPLVNNPGYLILTNMCLYYEPFRTHENEQQIIKIKLGTIRYVIKRRYHLKGVGCEIVFDRKLESTVESPSTSAAAPSSKLPYLYLTFEKEEIRDQFHTNLVVLQRDKLVNLNEFSQENMLQKWRYGAISNFDYLMYLNNMADRSYNDLTQYPVFPWVLADYTSETLDLNDPAVFRDLSKPVGALNEERLARLKQRYAEMQATTTSFTQNSADKAPQPMFLYGSHYSTPAFVLFYLVRQYPEWQLCLQNGRFDHPNRLFHSIADTWRNCLTIDSDVKELIPEFYDTNVETSDHSSDDDYRLAWSNGGQKLGSFLRNDLELDLGVRSDGTRVNHVVLPKWANNSPAEFIRRMRDALESPCVSEQLHKWIDLIFGYKQRDAEAIKADNLFYYLCYEGSVDLNSITNYSERKSLEIQIQEFGQIPTHLFKQPHLARVKADLVNDLKTLSLIEYERERQQLDDQFADNLLDLLVNKSHEGRQTYPPIITAPKKKGSISGQSDKSTGSATSGFTHSPYRINATNLSQLTVKLEIKLHKESINDCLFIDPPPTPQATSHQNTPTAPTALNDNLITLPLVCSVSSDHWMKIYSLEDRSIFRSHNVCGFSLSSVDCVQVASSEVASPLFSDSEESELQQGEEEDDYEHIEIDQLALGDSLGKQTAKNEAGSKAKNRSFNSTAGQTQYSRTLLFLSCWDNSIYIYDMNYNRCIHSLNSSHDDAVTRIRTKLIKRRVNPKRTRAGLSVASSGSLRSSDYSVAFYLITSSWDSLIKLWRLPTSNVKYQATSNRRLSVGSPATTPTAHSMSNRLSGMSEYFRSSHHHVQHPSLNLLNSDSIRLQFSNELCHDLAISDFQLSKSYLASLCTDGSLYLWKLVRSKSHSPAHIIGSGHALSSLAAENQDGQLELTEDDFDDLDPDGEESESSFGEESAVDSSADHQSDKKEDYSYSFVYSIQSCEEEIGKITDCKLIEAPSNDYASNRQEQVHTLAICTSLGYVKIYNLKTKCELFSLRIQVPQTQTNAKLNKLHYTNDLIITIDSSGHIYFIDLKQQQQLTKPGALPSAVTQQPPTLSLSSSFLSHTIKLTSNSLTCLSLYNEIIISVGDSAGNLYFLSLFDF